MRRTLPLAVVAVLLASPAAGGEKPSKAPRALTLVFAGGSSGDGRTPTLDALAARLESLEPQSTVVVFTGNYSDGELPPDEHPRREVAERAVLAHVDATRDFVARGGRVWFVPGHRDFAREGTRAVLRLRRLLNRSYEAATDRELDVMPEPACGTPVVLELTREVALLLLDSQWWMQLEADDPELNQRCHTRTRAAFEAELVSVLRDWRDRRLVIVSHHPLQSWGELGGAFTAGAHLEPLPVLGSLSVFARQAGLVEQHQSHPLVHSWAELLRAEADRNGRYVFVSGHDASQQHLAVGRQAQLVSGTSAREGRPVLTPEPPDLAIGSPGWLELTLDAGGEGLARWFGPSSKLLFEAALPPLAKPTTPPPAPADGVAPTAAAASFSKQPVWQFPRAVKLFVGSFYSEAFALKLPYEVLNLDT